jgi:hypothetical protein
MKKKKLALLGFAALTGVALASCGGGNGGSGTNSGSNTGGTTPQTSSGSGEEEVNDPTNVVWNPISFADAKKSYTIDSTKGVDAWLVYDSKYGFTYRDANAVKNPLNPITGKTIVDGDILPAWDAFQTSLGISINQNGEYKSNKDNYTSLTNAWTADESAAKGGYYKGANNSVVDVFFNTTDNLNELGKNDKMYNLKKAITDGKMPAFKKFLEDNPAVETEITNSKGEIYFTPYLDGYQAIERMYVVDSEQIARLLDDDYDATTLGKLAAGKNGAEKGLKLDNGTKITPYVAKDGKNYASDTTIDIVDTKTRKKVQVTVKSTDDIITKQNTLLNAGTTGGAVLEQVKAYIDAAYGDLMKTNVGG